MSARLATEITRTYSRSGSATRMLDIGTPKVDDTSIPYFSRPYDENDSCPSNVVARIAAHS